MIVSGSSFPAASTTAMTEIPSFSSFSSLAPPVVSLVVALASAIVSD
jgi:hypothetical protein